MDLQGNPQGTMNKNKVIGLRPEIERDLARLAKKHGLVIQVGNVRFTSTSVKFDLSLSEVTPDGDILTPEAIALDRMVARGEVKFTRNQTIRIRQSNLTGRLTGFVSRRPRYPFNFTEALSGKKYKLDRTSIQFAVLNDQ